MTVPTQTNKAIFTANGVTTEFPFTFGTLPTADLVVTLIDGDDETVVNPSDYTVRGAGRDDGGSVVFNDPPASGLTVLIQRMVPYTQPTDYKNQGSFYPRTHERSFDRNVMQVQQLAEEVGRTLRIPAYVQGVSMDMPRPVGGSFWGWDAEGVAPKLYSISDIATTAVFQSWRVQKFVGDGVTDTFTLENDPGNIANLDVSVDGVVLAPGEDYTLLGQELAFAVPPEQDARILVRYGQAVPEQGASGSDMYEMPVEAGDTIVGMEAAAASSGQIIAVFHNGIAQHPSAYRVSGSSIQFTEPLPVGGSVAVLTSRVPANSVGTGNIAVTAEGAGAQSRRLTDALRDVISVASYASASDAVARAAAVGGQVYWPAGAVEVAESVPNLHTVRHTGEGRIVRDGRTFYLNPKHGQSNTLYVDPTGDNANDGITPDAPFATLQAALTALGNYGPELHGTWTIQLAAGTYAGAQFPIGLSARTTVIIKGPDVGGHPNVPTAIIDAAGSAYRNGIGGQRRANVEIRDVKIQGFSGTGEAGIVFMEHSRVILRNVHVDDCYIGWSFADFVFYTAQGGIIAGCEYGIQELFDVVRNFKTVAALADGTQITGCTYGIFAKEHCTGHFDWVTIDGCDYGVFFSRSCTANASDSKITNNTVGVVLRHGSWFVPLRIDWGIGGADANTTNFLNDHASGFTVNENAVAATFSAQGERQIGYSAGVPAHTGTTAETTLLNFGKIMGGSFDYPGRYIRAVVLGRKDGTAGTANLILEIGTNIPITIPATMTNFKVEFYFVSNGAGAQKVWAKVSGTGADDATVRTTRALALTANASVLLECVLSDAADSITIDAAWLYTTGAVLSDGL